VIVRIRLSSNQHKWAETVDPNHAFKAIFLRIDDLRLDYDPTESTQSNSKIVLDHFAILDGIIVLIYFAAVLGIGYYHGRNNRGSDDFISGSRQIPWFAVLCSLVATEVSAATFLGTPGVGFAENMSYLQFGVGSLLARVFIAMVFLGAFYAGSYLTIYAYLADRFGNGTRYTATLLFMLTRLLASAVRLMIAATGLSLILGIPFWICLVVFTIIAIIYTGNGGIRGIIYTDALQGFVFIISGFVVLAFIVYSVGWSQIIEIGQANQRFTIFRFSPESSDAGLLDWLNDPKLFLIAVVFGFISTTAAFGTDQDMTQRILTSKDVHAARRSVIISGFIAIPVAALFLFIGVALFAYYQINFDPSLPSSLLADGSSQVTADKVFPWFIRNELPMGLRGLLLVGVLAAAMSSLDSTMGALSSSALVDLYRPLLNKIPDEKSGVQLSRLFIIIAGILMAVIAWILKDAEGFLWLTFKIGSITYGALLGIFLLGIVTNRGDDTGNWIAMLSGCAICVGLLCAIEFGWIGLGWTWLILIGTVWTFGIGALWKGPRGEIQKAV
jgi:SSS family transporter